MFCFDLFNGCSLGTISLMSVWNIQPVHQIFIEQQEGNFFKVNRCKNDEWPEDMADNSERNPLERSWEKKNATGNRDTILCSAAAEWAMNMENACSHLSKGLNDLKQYGTHEKNHFLG